MRIKKKIFSHVLLFLLLLLATCTFLAPVVATPWKDKLFAKAYLLASKLTDPISRAHLSYKKSLIVETLYPFSSSFEKQIRKGIFFFESWGHSLFALFTTLPGIELRCATLLLQERPYLHFLGLAEEKKLLEPSFTLFSWNVCGLSGGYSITDGGVMPWHHRIGKLCETMRETDADLICLYEVFDIQTALEIYKELKENYCHFYFHMGPNPVGLSSGLFVATKLALEAPEFIPFSKEQFYGRAKHCRKGFFSFTLLNEDLPLCRVYTTHLQHSEQPRAPHLGELRAREWGMALIISHLLEYKKLPCILTGDLNLEEGEFQAASWSGLFDQGIIEREGSTWGGDSFCASLVGKSCSPPLKLDYTLVTKQSGARLETRYVDTGFEGIRFNPHALSDHKGLLSTITF